MNGARSGLVHREAVNRIDIGAAARAQAPVMQPRSVLIETDAALLMGCTAHKPETQKSLAWGFPHGL